MKKVFLFLGMVLSTVLVTAQEVEEPEFAGEVVVIRANKTSLHWKNKLVKVVQLYQLEQSWLG
jgi:hypothetical protein